MLFYNERLLQSDLFGELSEDAVMRLTVLARRRTYVAG